MVRYCSERIGALIDSNSARSLPLAQIICPRNLEQHAFLVLGPLKMSSACCLDPSTGPGGSLRLRNGNNNCPGGTSNTFVSCKTNEVKGCTSVMSPTTKRLLPPNTDTVQTKPFPIRGKSSYFLLLYLIDSYVFSLLTFHYFIGFSSVADT